MRLVWALMALSLLVLASESASAECQEYLLPLDVVGVCVYPGSISPQLPAKVCVGQSDFIFGPGTVDPDGTGTILISDDLVSPVSGAVCQDLDGDAVCGEGEPSLPFCGAAEITFGPNWDATANLIVHVDGPLHGNPVTSTCGTTLSMGTHGWVCVA
jgi:hypothetical protein